MKIKNMYPTKKVQKYLNDFKQEKSDAKRKFSHWLAAFSVEVWEDLEILHNLGKELRYGETTITEKLVMGLLKAIKDDKIPMPIRMFHSTDEKANGSDIEIIVEIAPNRYVIFPCQAKKLYVQEKGSTPKYETFFHNKGEQKKKLIAYAEKIKGFPLYLLYNYSKTFKEKDKELYGCTLISAIHLADKGTEIPQKPTFDDLHPPAQPLRTIMDIRTLAALNKEYGQISCHSAKPYTKIEIKNKELWYELAPIKTRFASSVDIKELLKTNLLTNIDDDFNPSFRIIITKEIIYEERTINF
jgi:hypothetical protein